MWKIRKMETHHHIIIITIVRKISSFFRIFIATSYVVLILRIEGVFGARHIWLRSIILLS